MAGFLNALPHIFEAEGGYVDHALDPGGRTNRGITQRTYTAWRRMNDLPDRHVKEISEDEVRAIYHREWVRGKCDALPWPLSMVHFDSVVNHGAGNAARLLQRALGVKDDGVIGPITLDAASVADTLATVSELLLERLGFYRKIVERKPSQRVFLLGWINRLIRLRRTIHERAMGRYRSSTA